MLHFFALPVSQPQENGGFKTSNLSTAPPIPPRRRPRLKGPKPIQSRHKQMVNRSYNTQAQNKKSNLDSNEDEDDDEDEDDEASEENSKADSSDESVSRKYPKSGSSKQDQSDMVLQLLNSIGSNFASRKMMAGTARSTFDFCALKLQLEKVKASGLLIAPTWTLGFDAQLFARTCRVLPAYMQNFMPPKLARFTASADKRTFEQFIDTVHIHKDAAWAEVRAMFDTRAFRVMEPPSAAFKQLCQDFFDGKEVVADYDTAETSSQNSDLIDLDDTSTALPSESLSYDISWYHDQIDMWNEPLSDPKLVVFLVDALLSKEIKKAISENTKYKMMRVFHSHDHASHTTKLNQLEKAWVTGSAAVWKEGRMSMHLSAAEIPSGNRTLRYVDEKIAKTLQVVNIEQSAGEKGIDLQVATIHVDDILGGKPEDKEEDGSTDVDEIISKPEKPTKFLKTKKKKKKGKKYEIEMASEVNVAQNTEGDTAKILESEQTNLHGIVEETAPASVILNDESNQVLETEAKLQTSREEGERCSAHPKSSEDHTLKILKAEKSVTNVVIEKPLAILAEEKNEKSEKHNIFAQELDAEAECQVVLPKHTNIDIARGSMDEGQASQIHPRLHQADPSSTADKQLTSLSAIAKSSNNDSPKSKDAVSRATVPAAPQDNASLPTLANSTVSENSSVFRAKSVSEDTLPVQTNTKSKTEYRAKRKAKAKAKARAQVEASQGASVLGSTSHSYVSDEVTHVPAAQISNPIPPVQNGGSGSELNRKITPVTNHTASTSKPMIIASNYRQGVPAPVVKVAKQTATVRKPSKLVIPAVPADVQSKAKAEPPEPYVSPPPTVNQPCVEASAQSPLPDANLPVLSTNPGTQEPQEQEESLPRNRFPSLQDLKSRFKENGTVTLEAEIPAQMTAVRNPRVLALQFGDAPIGSGLSLPLASTREPQFYHPDASPPNDFAVMDDTNYYSPEQISTGPGLYSADNTPEYYVPSPSFVTTVPGTDPKDLASFSGNMNGNYQIGIPPGLQRNPIFQARTSRSFSMPPQASNAMVDTPKPTVNDPFGHDTEEENRGHVHAHPSVSENHLSEQSDQSRAKSSSYACVCCKLERHATPDEPVYFCPFCGPLNNVRYCSRACILADAFEHASKCVKYPASHSAVIIDPPSHYVYDRDAIMSHQGWDVQESPALIRQKIFSMYCSTGEFPEVCKAWSMKDEARAGIYHPDFYEKSSKITGDYHIFCSVNIAAGDFSPAEVITTFNLPAADRLKRDFNRLLLVCFMFPKMDPPLVIFLYRLIRWLILSDFYYSFQAVPREMLLREFRSQFNAEFGTQISDYNEPPPLNLGLEWTSIDTALLRYEARYPDLVIHLMRKLPHVITYPTPPM